MSELARVRQNVLTPDFILLALIEQPDTEARRVIEHLSDDPKTVVTNIGSRIQLHFQNAAPVAMTRIVASQEVADLFQVAMEEAKALGDRYVSTGTLFLP